MPQVVENNPLQAKSTDTNTNVQAEKSPEVHSSLACSDFSRMAMPIVSSIVGGVGGAIGGGTAGAAVGGPPGAVYGSYAGASLGSATAAAATEAAMQKHCDGEIDAKKVAVIGAGGLVGAGAALAVRVPAAAVGAVAARATGYGIASGVTEGAVMGGAASGGYDIAKQSIDGNPDGFNFKEFGTSVATGALFGGVVGATQTVIMDKMRESAAKKVGDFGHEQWKETHYKMRGEGEPRWKPVKDESWAAENISNPNVRINEKGVAELDITKFTNSQLPAAHQAENLAGGAAAVDAVNRRLSNGVPIDEKFVLGAADDVHKSWLSRNGEWASGMARDSFDDIVAVARQGSSAEVRSEAMDLAVMDVDFVIEGLRATNEQLGNTAGRLDLNALREQAINSILGN